MPPAILIDSLVASSTFILVALGLVLLFSIMGILNFAHGQFYMMGAYVVYYAFQQTGINFFVSLVAAAVVIGLLGLVLEKYIMRPIGQPMQIVVVTVGLSSVFEGVITLIAGPAPKSVNTSFPGTFTLGNISLSNERVATVVIAVILIAALWLFIQKTKFGLAMRASAQQPTAAGLFGIHVARTASIVMGIGCGLAALAGGIMAPLFYVDPWIGGPQVVWALMAIVIGGMGSLGGAVIGGLILGITSSIVAYYIGFWSQLLSFGLVIAILLIRPEGLFGIAEK
ncbi:MAG: branched-chain amino acid ABC transporter permease [Chloroflexi bacterium]|nr:branched-chain amino acid ABC transporter permease [Chloroflexota bacterium]